ncbi:hypothetical protein SAMN05421869_15355 [Nonomuraea jiangxiensis]|uniref:Secreted protein n=1 Tax=Nonomuraea jiangxiensis TaxID=633440 RepID=A0A1G9VKJ1_9ACTN|nr:hypothetical protein SAMN05421869_15355 [Nonomuraea jiangxiensis]
MRPPGGAKSLWSRGAIVTAIVSLLVLALSSPASADVIYDDGHVYAGDGPCTWARAEVSHGGGGGYTRSDVAQDYQLQTPWGSYDCRDTTPTQGAGRMALRYDWYYWNGTEWRICGVSDWHYNPQTSHSFAIAWDFGANPLCGPGYYGTMTAAFTLNGTEWLGGPLWSGSHYLPA